MQCSRFFHNASREISLPYFGKISWVGVIKCRRFTMIIVYAFIETPLCRVVLLLAITLVHVIHHTIVKPYKGNSTSNAAIFSMLATFAIGIVNLIKATLEFVEYKVTVRDQILLQILDITEDCLLVWFPLLLICLCVIGAFFFMIYMLCCGPKQKKQWRFQWLHARKTICILLIENEWKPVCITVIPMQTTGPDPGFPVGGVDPFWGGLASDVGTFQWKCMRKQRNWVL